MIKQTGQKTSYQISEKQLREIIGVPADEKIHQIEIPSVNPDLITFETHKKSSYEEKIDKNEHIRKKFI